MSNFKSIGMLLLVAFVFIGIGCSSSGSARKVSPDQRENMTLDDFIRRLNGVRINGSGDYARVVMRSRGVSNANFGMGEPDSKSDMNMAQSNNHQPLFVVDGQKVGRDYSNVRDMFAPGEIKSVRLLSDSEAARYGNQSGAGVIEITTVAGAMKDEHFNKDS